jgi:hypothetical protein
MDFKSFARLPIIDGHVHFVHPEYLDDMIHLLDESGCARANLVCIPNRDGSTHNPAALYFKECYPERAFISAALEYAPALADPVHAPDILAAQVRAFKARGFDGLKLIEGKPEVRKLLPHPLDGPLYVPMWAALEEEQLPVVFHVADPDEFWDAQACPTWARQAGWDYSDGTFPAKEELYAEVDHILARHPRLKITLAHFYFLSGQLGRAAQFLKAHPSVCFDLAPHTGMYQDFSRQPVEARQFFLEFQDRILYGTDLDTRTLARGESGRAFMRFIPWLVRSCLETDGEFATDQNSRYHGLGLPDAVLRKIYSANFERIYGNVP